jgi:hypothetical protein
MCGQHDLDVRGQHSTTAEAIRRFVQHPSDRCRGRIDSALCEPETGQSWLRLRTTDRTHVTMTPRTIHL